MRVVDWTGREVSHHWRYFVRVRLPRPTDWMTADVVALIILVTPQIEIVTPAAPTTLALGFVDLFLLFIEHQFATKAEEAIAVIKFRLISCCCCRLVGLELCCPSWNQQIVWGISKCCRMTLSDFRFYLLILFVFWNICSILTLMIDTCWFGTVIGTTGLSMSCLIEVRGVDQKTQDQRRSGTRLTSVCQTLSDYHSGNILQSLSSK